MVLRSLLVNSFGALLLAGVAHAAIRAYPLDDRTVYTICLSPEAPTTCVFPGTLTALEGAQIAAKPEDSGAPVLLSYQPGADYFSMRAARAGATGALNVVFRAKVYVLRFTTDGEPDRSVTFLDQPLTGTPRPPITETDLKALLERARNHAHLAAQYPALASMVERATPGTVTAYRDFTATVEEVFRFDAEDTLVLRIRLDNANRTAISYDPTALGVRVGHEIYPAAAAEASGAIPPASATRVYVAITGSPRGGRANLSVRENFNVIVPRP